MVWELLFKGTGVYLVLIGELQDQNESEMDIIIALTERTENGMEDRSEAGYDLDRIWPPNLEEDTCCAKELGTAQQTASAPKSGTKLYAQSSVHKDYDCGWRRIGLACRGLRAWSGVQVFEVSEKFRLGRRRVTHPFEVQYIGIVCL